MNQNTDLEEVQDYTNKWKNETRDRKYIHKQFTVLFVKHKSKLQSNKSTMKALSAFDMAASRLTKRICK